MPLPEQLIINADDLPNKPVLGTYDYIRIGGKSLPAMNPAPFDIDTHFNEWNNMQPKEKVSDNHSAFAKIGWYFGSPFLSQGYNAASALNRGMASFSAHLDGIADFIEATTGMKSEGLFEKAAEVYQENADYWKERADKVGMGFIDELVSEAVGGAIPGITTFVLDVASGLTFPFMAGTGEALKNKEDHPIVKGLIEAAKTGLLSWLFRMISPLKQYLKAPTMGTIFGVEEAAVAPEGEKARGFAKGFGTGLGYSLASPGGQLGLNEIKRGLEPDLQLIRKIAKETGEFSFEKFHEERGSLGKEPEPKKKQRKFLKTVEESPLTEPEVSKKVTEVEPQEYIVQPNAESLSKADARIEKEGVDKTIDYLKSDADLNAEKGATFISMIERFQKAGDYDRAVETIETYDMQLREAGRFVQAASIWNRLTPNGFLRWADKQLAATKSKYSWLDTIFKNKPELTLTKAEKAEITKRMIEINKMPEGIDKTDATLQLIDEIAKKVPPSVSELIDAYRYQNMLSGPRTQERNIGENLFNAFITRPVDVTTRGAIDYVKAGLFGKDRKNYVGDVPTYYKAAVNSVPNAVKGFMEVMRAEKGLEIGKPEIGFEVKSEFERARFKQIPTSLTLVTRFMEASDKFFSSIIGAGEFAIQKKNGATDAVAYKRAEEISQKYLYRDKLDPSDPDLSIFSKTLSSVGKMMTDSRKLPGLGTVSKWFVPFIRTPVNKGIQMVERSPLGLARGNFNNEALAKIISGSVFTAVGAMFAYNGKTTWTPPTDTKEKEFFYASGKKAFSVQIGDKWIPVWYLGPYALAFALPAAVKYYTHDRKQALTEDSVEKILNIAKATAQFVGSQSSTQSIGAMFKALSGDIDFTFTSTTAFTAEQIIPGQGLVRFVQTIVDPIYRKPTGFWEQIEKDLPGISNDLEARMTPFFEEAKRDPVNYFLPYDIGKKDLRYEVFEPFIRSESRQRHINNKINKLIKEMNAGKITPEESMEKLSELFGANMKNLQMFGEEFNKGE